MPKTGCLCLLLLTTLCFSAGYGQPTGNDSAQYSASVNNVKAAFQSAVKERSLLYNGIAYEAFGHGQGGTPFFVADSLVSGSVMYDGSLYENIPLKYDMVNDVAVSTYYHNNALMQLVSDKLAWFSLMGRNFVRIDKDTQQDGPAGFCELLYKDDKTMALAKRYKQLKMSTAIDDKTSSFVQFNDFYIYRGGKYYTVDDESSLAKAFGDKADAVKKYLRSKKIRYKKSAEKAILAATTFYNGLTN